MERVYRLPDSEGLTPETVLISSITTEEVRWLWRGRLALGKMSILDGDPGLGKTTLTLEIAARVSNGDALPGGPPIPASGVLLLSGEDDPGDTIRPRLEHAGADIRRVAIHRARGENTGNEFPTTIPDHIALIESSLQAMGARLLIVDPLFAFLSGEVNANRDQDVRRALIQLKTMAERTGVAVLLIRHLNKGSSASALYRGGGSIGIIGAARFGMVMARDPEDRTKRVLAIQKCNIGPEMEPLTFRLVGVPGTEVARVEWLGRSHHTADELLDQGATLEERAARNEAASWLRDRLVAGPVATKELQRLAREDGMAWRTIERAKHALGVESKRQGFGTSGAYSWELPVKRVSVHGTSVMDRQVVDSPNSAPESIDPMFRHSANDDSDEDNDPFLEG